MPNLKFSYLYRDSENSKKYGQVIFDNPDDLSPGELEPLIQSKLVDGLMFSAEDWGCPALYHGTGNTQNRWHEFLDLTFTDEEADSALSLYIFCKVLTTEIKSLTESFAGTDEISSFANTAV